MVQVWHYDGENGVRQTPDLIRVDGGFMLVGARNSGPFAFTDLDARGETAGQAEYGLRGKPGWRIGFPEGVPQALAADMPKAGKYGRLIDRYGFLPAVGVFAVVAAVILFGMFQMPKYAKHMLPVSLEKKWGDAMLGDLGGRVCEAPAGVAALNKMKARLGTANDISVRVIDVPIVNAAALPGRNIVIFDQLLADADSAEEVAGVLAHEIGHVENRDVVESMVRQFGLSLLLGGFDGNVGAYTQALISAGYSRSTESQADAYALGQLQQSNVDTAPTAAFFQRLGGETKGMEGAERLFSYISSHPLSSEREAYFKRGSKGAGPAILTAQEWAALKAICSERNASQESSWFGF